MNHPGDLLSALLDGELTPEEIGAVSEHLDMCAACRAELEATAAARTALRSLPVLDPPPGLLPG
ncbi:MAG: zf-HC2 domain-containing protein, partial [Actinobacteria bacterium]|nr:zf-HC2 domain-containing protein [Actinomycetota bacterium]